MTGQSPPEAAGASAAMQGEPLTVCPYSPATPEGRAWHVAWARAEWQHQMTSGEAARRTAAMKADAHASAAIIDPRRYGDNPVDALMAEVAPERLAPTPFPMSAAENPAGVQGSGGRDHPDGRPHHRRRPCLLRDD